MNDITVYLIKLQGQVDEVEINLMSPLQMKVEQIDADTTQLNVHTDQSGLVGLIRYLHGEGFIFLAINLKS